MNSSRPTPRRRQAPTPARRRGTLLTRLLSIGLAKDAVALAALALTVLLLVSLLTYDINDPAPLVGTEGGHLRPTNAAGPFGAWLAAAAYQSVGLAAWVLPGLALISAWSLLFRGGARRAGSRLTGGLLLLTAITGLLQVAAGGPGGTAPHPGGWLGAAVARLLAAVFGRTGALVMLLTVLGLATLLLSRLGLADLMRLAGTGLRTLARRARLRWTLMRDARRRHRLQQQAVRRHLGRPAPDAATPEVEPQAATAPSPGPSAATGRAPEPRITPARPPRPAEPAPPAPRQRTLAEATGAHVLPPLTLLNARGEENPIDEQELVEKARLLTAKLQEFGVGGSVMAIHPGPVITTFEFKPDPGVKYSRVTTLVDDLSLALKAESVRIDRIPGRSTIGIEVPNRHRETIRIREVLESEAFRGTRGRLPLALGKTIDGRACASALDRMPHLLIAGATGAGKSVGLNAMIASILFHASPDDVKFIMIDPKMLELGLYEDIPHLICPVVTDPNRAARALKWATLEMTRRYELLFGHGVRNLEQFNRLAAAGAALAPVPEGGKPAPLQPLPSIIVVIDELADLMMVSSKEVEAAIQRIAQMARAVGIHLIVATQRPSVDVITGVIKANFPCRIAFRVSSRTDSTVILDQKGAERLLGMGDMLFLPPGASSLQRIHGALVEEAEVQRLVAFLKQQGRPVFNEDLLRDDDATGRRRRRPGRRHATTAMTRPPAWSPRSDRPRSRTCSAASGSATRAPPGSWMRSRRTASSGQPTAASRAKCSYRPTTTNRSTAARPDPLRRGSVGRERVAD